MLEKTLTPGQLPMIQERLAGYWRLVDDARETRFWLNEQLGKYPLLARLDSQMKYPLIELAPEMVVANWKQLDDPRGDLGEDSVYMRFFRAEDLLREQKDSLPFDREVGQLGVEPLFEDSFMVSTYGEVREGGARVGLLVIVHDESHQYLSRVRVIAGRRADPKLEFDFVPLLNEQGFDFLVWDVGPNHKTNPEGVYCQWSYYREAFRRERELVEFVRTGDVVRMTVDAKLTRSKQLVLEVPAGYLRQE